MYRNIKLSGTGLERNKKLSSDDVKTMRELYNSGNYTYKQLADQYNVSISTIIYRVKSNLEKQKAFNKYKRAWYYNKTLEERQTMCKKWAESHREYIDQLLDTKQENLFNNLKEVNNDNRI